MYMEKLDRGPQGERRHRSRSGPGLNLKAVAKALGKPLSRPTVITWPNRVATRRQGDAGLGCGVRHSRWRRGGLHPHLSAGQRSGTCSTASVGAGRVISAAVIRALDGDMQASPDPRHQVQG